MQYMDLLLSPSSSSDWDLLAVVRGCRSKSTTSSSLPDDLQHQQHCYKELTTNRFPQPPLLSQTTPQTLPEFIEFPSLAGELHDLFNPFCSSNLNFSTPYNTSLRSSILTPPPPQQSSQIVFGSTTTTTGSCSSSPTASSSTPPNNSTKFSISNINPITFQSKRNSTTPLDTHKTKKRKNLQKKVVVVQVPAEGLSSSSSNDDKWAWRKYGQKPIKGSPYPRGYYRCSTSKGCLARKQVERNKTNPNLFIITYTADHNHQMPTHRNSLAGTIRQPKPSTSPSSSTSSSTAGDHRYYSRVQDCSSPSTMTNDSLVSTLLTTNVIQSTAECKMEAEENVCCEKGEMIAGFEDDDADFLPGFMDFVDDMDVGDGMFDKLIF